MLASMLTDRYSYSEWHIFLADERIVPLTDENSTYGEFQRRCGSSNKFLSESNFSPLFDANVELDVAAKAYEDRLRDVQFDMVILGMGPDGHTASIFPPVTREMLEEQCSVVIIRDSPKPPSLRITMSLTRLINTNRVVVVAMGENKADMIERTVIERDPDLPISHLINALGSKVKFIIDENAAASIKNET